jgi:hypothetical protein
MSRNAKQELLEALSDAGNYSIKCAIVHVSDEPLLPQKDCIMLKQGYSHGDFNEFLDKLDFDYEEFPSDDDYMFVNGTVWFSSVDIWLEVSEKSGAWVECGEPDIPSFLNHVGK